MEADEWQQFRSKAKATGEQCDECACKLYRDITASGGSTKCRNGHNPGPDICGDCGEEALDHPSLGKICGCES